MTMNAKSRETYLTTQLSKLTGESLTTAVTYAVRERLERVRRDRFDDFIKAADFAIETVTERQRKWRGRPIANSVAVAGIGPS